VVLFGTNQENSMWETIISSDSELLKEIFDNNREAVTDKFEEATARFNATPKDIINELINMAASNDPTVWNIAEVPWQYFGDAELTSKVEEWSPIQQSLLSAVYNYKMETTHTAVDDIEQLLDNRIAVGAFFVGLIIIFILIK
jgi:hypothetical protein